MTSTTQGTGIDRGTFDAGVSAAICRMGLARPARAAGGSQCVRFARCAGERVVATARARKDVGAGAVGLTSQPLHAVLAKPCAGQITADAAGATARGALV